MSYLLAGRDTGTVSDWIRQHALVACGAMRQAMADSIWLARLKHAQAEEYCTVPPPPDMAKACLDRMLMGTLRYNSDGRGAYTGAVIESALARWAEYCRPDGGNREHLCDIVNLCKVEWLWPNQQTCFGPVHSPNTVEDALIAYLCVGNRGRLAAAIDAARREWLTPTHPNAHWAPADCGGHWSLRNP